MIIEFPDKRLEFIEQIKILEELKVLMYKNLNAWQIDQFNHKLRDQRLPLIGDVIDNPTLMVISKQANIGLKQEFKVPEEQKTDINLAAFIKRTESLPLRKHIELVQEKN